MMKKSLAAVTVGLMAVAVLAGCSSDSEPETTPGAGGETTAPTDGLFSQELHDLLPEDIRSSGVVSVAGETNQPWRIVAADGSVTGLGQDFLEKLGEVLGVEFETEMVTGLPAVKLGFQSGRNDLGFGPLLINDATLKDVTFIEYLYGRPGLVYSADGDETTKLTDICGRTVAFLDGSLAWAAAFDAVDPLCLEEGEAVIDRLPLADINAAVLAVESGRADFAGVGAHQSAYTAQENPDKFRNYIATADEWTSDSLGMGFEVNNLELAEAIFAAWEVLFAEGVYDELMAEYGLTEIAVPEPVLHVGGAAG